MTSAHRARNPASAGLTSRLGGRVSSSASVLQRDDDLGRREHVLGVDRGVELDRGVHVLLSESRGGVLDQGDGVGEFKRLS
jgi:hypothetical protein